MTETMKPVLNVTKHHFKIRGISSKNVVFMGEDCAYAMPIDKVLFGSEEEAIGYLKTHLYIVDDYDDIAYKAEVEKGNGNNSWILYKDGFPEAKIFLYCDFYCIFAQEY